MKSVWSVKKKALSLYATVCNILQCNEISHDAFINMPNPLTFYKINFTVKSLCIVKDTMFRKSQLILFS